MISMNKTSSIHNFHNFSIEKRLEIIGDFCGLSKEERKELGGYTDLPHTENYIGKFSYPLRFANNFMINDKDYFIPMITEEASVVAAASHGAKLCHDNGGIIASVQEPVVYSKAMSQILFIDVKNHNKAIDGILKNKKHLLEKSRKGHRYSKPIEVDVESLGNDMIVYLHVDPIDCMGAATASEMLDSIASDISKITGSEYTAAFPSNCAGRLTRAELEVPIRDLKIKGISGENWNGEDVSRRILSLDRLAKETEERTVTHNKGIMNHVTAVAIPTLQDTRAIESASSYYAFRDGYCQPLSSWHVDGQYLKGELKTLIPCGIVGGEINRYPQSKLIIEKVLKLESGDQLAEIIASAGLAGNLSAMIMNSTYGLKEGHELHRV